VNFRDLGGYRTADGRRLGWRRLFRADGLSTLTDADQGQLTELGVATVIDLRTVDETEQRAGSRSTGSRCATSASPHDVLPTPEELPSWGQASYVPDGTARWSPRAGRP